jgi:hypothetical protein
VRRVALLVILCLLSPATAAAQGLWPGTTYDPAVPTLGQVIGHEPGDAITTPDQIVRYLEALARAAPDRTRLVQYATSWEERPLYYLIVGSPARIARLEDIRQGMQALAHPETLDKTAAARLLDDLPVIVLLMHGVHGNEVSSSDAALQEAYHLLAARGDEIVDTILRDALVIIDPVQNPDGRHRFVTTNRAAASRWPDPEPLAAERDEPWPGGRSNHYLFDMNRDYFAQSQPETQGRIRLMLEWYPQVVVDLHEMSGESTYYFAPPAHPINPLVTEAQRRWFDVFGRANATAFDRRGFAYFVREVYDSFYPGYGESWPTFHGAIGMTYEQASARGLVFRRRDDTLLTYRQGVTQHFAAAITTAHTAAVSRERLLRDFLDFRRSAIAMGQQGTREYLLLPGADPSRAAALARLIASQGLVVRRAEETFQSGGRSLPPGTFIVPLAQPAGRLARNLLDPEIRMDDAFIKEQERRRKLRLRDEIYDVTAWSLPLAFDVEVVASDRPSTARSTPVRRDDERSVPAPVPHALGFLMPWGSAAAAVTAEALREGIRIQTADEPFTHGGRSYAVGTAFVRLSENPDGSAVTLQSMAARLGAELVPVVDTWTDEGASLGGGRMARLKDPRVMLAWDAPTSSLSAGWARYTLERRFGQRVAAVRVPALQKIDMRHFDVIVLPSATYTFTEDFVRRLKDWIQQGGTLITVADASRWAARQQVGILATHTLLRDGTPERDPAPASQTTGQAPAASAAQPATAKPTATQKPDEPFDYDTAIQPERERPEAQAGAMLRVNLDLHHWLTAGLDDTVQVIIQGQRVFAPVRLDAGRNVGAYADADRLVASGHVWKESLPLLAQRAYLMHQPVGRGHVIAFAEDPNYRAFTEATQLLFINAVLLAPAH